MMYYIKTVTGYYYAHALGKYGRYDGQRLQAWQLCEQHRNEQTQLLDTLSIHYEIEELSLDWCSQCHANKIKLS